MAVKINFLDSNPHWQRRKESIKAKKYYIYHVRDFYLIHGKKGFYAQVEIDTIISSVENFVGDTYILQLLTSIKPYFCLMLGFVPTDI